MEQVFFTAIDSYANTQAIQQASRHLLKLIIEKKQIHLESPVPLKVHFGEKGNDAFIAPKNYEGIIAYLQEQQIQSSYLETNALYRGERMTRTTHVKIAQEHGFTQLPVIIADGEVGDDYEDVVINQKHFRTCKIGREIARQKQMLVISHFKGHMLAGFGGAIKQLAMGCASRGGKLAQHSHSKPFINWLSCKRCHRCEKQCPVNAITISRFSKINKQLCIGCAACTGVCPHGAILHNPLASLSKSFHEKLAEYALAAQQGKQYIYITFALNLAKGCDCEGHKMKLVAPDLGVFASTDAVAIDQACLDLLDKRAGKPVFKRGRHTLEYAEKIGVGNRQYELIDIA